ncbi:MAG: ABC transporter ATP-binding protein/permease [Propionibacteriaceae bacterium]|jgi:macrolide transport system ATP-binding/permease protein|nr:ABC transporter ATP-binding protein/permease [Propionibacteriaceae bacterium]
MGEFDLGGRPPATAQAPGGGGTPLIEFDSVAKIIPGRRPVTALAAATCQIWRGEFVAMTGPSGSGKTTALSILGLLDRPTDGVYRLDGIDVGRFSERRRDDLRGRRLGFVFQNSFVVAEESVAENVALGLRVRGVDPAERRRRIATALERVGLSGLEGKSAGDLSGGEKQRVALARALVTGPEIILADEPTGALDAESTDHLVKLLQSINRAGVTIVVVTHDPIVAQAASRRIELVGGSMRPEADSWRPGLNGRSSRGPAVGALTGQPHLIGHAQHHETGSNERQMGDRPPASVGESGNDPTSDQPMGSRRRRWLQEVLDALAAPLTRPLRSSLVLLAYVLGVTALVGAVALTQSTTGQVVARLTEAASNEIVVDDQSAAADSVFYDSVGPDGGAARLARLTGVLAAVPVQTWAPSSNTISRFNLPGEKAFRGRLLVTNAGFLTLRGMAAASGRVDLLDNGWNGPVAAVGATAAEWFGLPSAGPGARLWVNGRPVDVIAILAPGTDPLLDDAIFFSAGCRPWLSGLVDKQILVKTGQGYAEPLARAIPAALSPASPGVIEVSTVAQLAQLQQGIDSDLARLLSVIGWVILILSTLTAATSMFLSVHHRAPEIALRRALGGTRGSVWRLFSLEGVAVGGAGGVLGAALGAGLAYAVCWAQGTVFSLGLGVVTTGWGVGLAAGLIAAGYPAVYAARRDPAAVLRTT